MKKTVSILVLFFIISFVFAQSDSLMMLNRKISYYKNGNPKKLETYINDSCDYFDVQEFEYYKDCCRDGIYKEWYKNGHLKVEGQYRYDVINDTFYNVDVDTGELIDAVVSNKKSYKTGLWNIYDSLGCEISTQRFIIDKLVAKKFNFKDTTININQDSVFIKLKEYSEISSYLINRSNNNSLCLEFPRHEIHNYWKIYDYKIYDLIYDDYPTNGLFFWKKEIAKFEYTDACGLCQNYFDFSKLPDGRYYVYYWSHHKIFYMVEIILNKT